MRSRTICGANLAAMLAVSCLASSARASVLYDESVSGDLSNNQAAPTARTLSVGTNSVLGTVNGSGDSQDWIAVAVPSGFTLSGCVLANYVSGDAQGFTGMQAGSSFVGSTVNPASYLGYSHFGTGATNGSLPPTNLINANLLPIMAGNSPGGTSAGAQGFTAPLAAGTYTFLIQQLGGATTYQFDFNVTPVPEPVTFGTVALGLAGMTLHRPRRRCGN
jgi:hypothetical protein